MIPWVSVALAGVVSDGALAYDEGRLEEAATIWASGVSRQASGVLLYDLGTVWYRRGDPARAVAYLRGALALRPRDGAVHHNLALARSELGILPPPVDAPVSWSLVVTPGELGMAGVVLTALGSLALAVGVRREGWTLPGTVALVVGLGASGVAGWGAMELWQHPVAVVVDQATSLRDAASADGRARADLPVGTEVRVERRYGGFLLVEDGRGRRGWVADGAVQLPHPFP